ncbi:MAG: YigZ family protein [Bacteroidota bacterium]|nr:YigZ family protein [Bacteroidota bacterium]
MSDDVDTYLSIKNASEGEFKDKGSKFLAYAYPVEKASEIEEKLEHLRKQHYNARHHVYAYVLGADKMQFRANDDGEPAHSSGDPVLGQIRSFNVTNVLVVVVRYFGGTKLGIPGLINAYKTAAQQALSNAKIIKVTRRKYLRIQFDYAVMDHVNRLILEQNLKVSEREFTTDCKMKIGVRLQRADDLIDRLNQSPDVKIIEVL